MDNRVESQQIAAAPLFVGRARELERFDDILQGALDGNRQLLLVTGDPGIGKTSYAEAISVVAEDRGALVLWARCYEEPGAPPYWPWTQALRAYADASTLDEMRLTIGDGLREIAAIVPEIIEHDDQRVETVSPSLETSSGSRFRTFAAVARFLGYAAESVPILLIIDNLHWADGPSLSLLEFCCQELSRKRLLICATYRESEVTRNCPLYQTLGGLGSLAGTNRIHLAGLSDDEIGRLADNLLGRDLPPSILEAVCRQTDGNPLYARELVKYLIDELADSSSDDIQVPVPDSIRETIGRRLSRLPEDCNSLLRTAAIFGRYFDATELAMSADRELPEVYGTLEPAIDARIVEEVARAAGRFRFTHALIRETLYEESSALDRLRLHARAGDALLQRQPDCPAEVLSRVAYHFGESASLGNAEKAVDFSLRAAERAVQVCAYEDAVVHFDRVIAALKLFADSNDERMATAFLGKGMVLKELGSVDRSIEALLSAIQVLRAVGNVELLVDVLMRLSISSSHVAQTHMVPLLEATLDALSDDDSVAVARATLMLAFARRKEIEVGQLSATVLNAIEVARNVCAGTELCDCYHLAQLALRANPETLLQRQELCDEHVACAQDTQIADVIAEAYHWQSLNLLEAGEIANLEDLLRRYSHLSAVNYGLHQYRHGSLNVIVALLRGHWDGLEEQIENLRRVGHNTRREDADGVYGAQMFALRRDQGRLDELAPIIRRLAEEPASSVWQPGLMLFCTELGMREEAQRIFGSLARDGFSTLRKDEMYLTCLAFCAETCAALGDEARASELLTLLQPYSDLTANHPTAVCYGTVAHYLGVLHATLNHVDMATQHYEHAIRRHREMNAWPWLVRSQVGLASLLTKAQDETANNRGRQLLGEAEPLADRLGMRRITAEIGAVLRPQAAAAAPDGLTAREVEVLELLAIGRSNKDISMVLAISLNTVATHVRSILVKSGCANRTEAAAYAIRHGLDKRPQ